MLVDPGARRAYAALSLALFAATCVPLFLVTYPPLLDLPNHLARAYILAHPEVPAFAAMYRPAWAPYPNLAIDVILLALQKVLPIAVAGKLFLVGLAALMHGGAHVLGREIHGRPTWLAPLAAFFFFTMYLLYGFVNYLFGVGLFYVAFAAWLRAHRSNRPVWLALAQLAAFGCYFAHLMALGCLALGALVWSIADRRVRPALAIFVLPAAFHLLAGTTPMGALQWEHFAGKLNAVAMLFSTYDRPLDLTIAALFAGGLALGLRRLHGRTLAVAAVFFAVFAVSPAVAGTAWAVDRRFLVPCAVLVLLAIELGPRWRVALALTVGATLARTVLVGSVWIGLGARVEAAVALMDVLPPGSRVAGFPFLHHEDKKNWTRSVAFGHAVHWGAIRRDLATWRLFAGETQQPIRVNPLPEPVAVWPLEGRPASEVDWGPLFRDFDAIWGYRLDDDYVATLRAHCATVDTAGLALLARGCHAP